MTTSEQADINDLSDAQIEQLLSDWKSLPKSAHQELFFALDRPTAEELFERIPSVDQAEILQAIPSANRKSWVRLLEPDDIADLIQNLPSDVQAPMIQLLDPPMRAEVTALMAYHEDQAGGLMNPRFARLRPDISVEEAIRYLRAQTTSQVETIYYAYVLDKTQKLLGVVSLRQLFRSPPERVVEEIMVRGDQLIMVHEDEDQEHIARIFSGNDFLALPVVDKDNHMKGIVTIDDIVQVVQEEATEDIQKFGGIEALDEPYFKISFLRMIKKRAGWLLVLFLGEMFTATAMGRYEDQISKAVVLALFIPLIISSGGNTGSQASTLIIRAMALGEVRLRDWWRVFIREVTSGLALGFILGGVGILRVFFWPGGQKLYGEHYGLISLTVGFSLIGVVLWGTLTGSMLPFVLKKAGFDPATASAPFVATLVDVTGIVIYFSMARLILSGLLM